MGTWGTGILENDTSSDVYADYMLLYETLSVEKIMERMTGLHKGKINSPEESTCFWLAIAVAQLETNTLQIEVFEKVKTIIVTDADIAVWKELKASIQDVESRAQELADFLDRLEKTDKK